MLNNQSIFLTIPEKRIDPSLPVTMNINGRSRTNSISSSGFAAPIDTASSVSSSMSTTKDSIVCKGTLDEKSALKAMYIPTEANVIQGDSIETSGLGGIYPKGIHIGTIKKVTNTQNMTDRYAIVETAVDFDKLDTVLVITNK